MIDKNAYYDDKVKSIVKKLALNDPVGWEQSLSIGPVPVGMTPDGKPVMQQGPIRIIAVTMRNTNALGQPDFVKIASIPMAFPPDSILEDAIASCLENLRQEREEDKAKAMQQSKEILGGLKL